MLIDWPTTIAQIINFLILLFLLRRFLYRPLLDAMAARREEIAREFEEAEQQQNRAEETQRTYSAKLAEWEEQRQSLLQEARTAAESLREEILQEARREAATERAAWQDSLRREQEAFLERLRVRSREQVLTVARLALRDMADADLESRVVAAFTRQLTTLDADTMRSLHESLRQAGNEVTVGSAFDLPDHLRQTVEKALHEALSLDGLHVRFQQAPDMIAGLEIFAGGQKLTWSLEGYLQSVEDSLADVLSADARHHGAQTGASD